MAEPPTYNVFTRWPRQKNPLSAVWGMVLLIVLIAGCVLFYTFAPSVRRKAIALDGSNIFEAIEKHPGRR